MTEGPLPDSATASRADNGYAKNPLTGGIESAGSTPTRHLAPAA